MSTDLLVARNNGSGGGSYCNGIQFEIFTLHPGDMTITGSGSASGSFTGASGGSQGYGQHPINGGSYSLTQGGSATNSSGSGSVSVTGSCSATGVTNLPGYTGIAYYPVSTIGTYRYKGSATLGSSTSAASSDLSASGSVSVTMATATPVAVISPDEPGATTGYPVTLYNSSYDPDGPGGTQPTCSAVWTISGPSGTVTPSSVNNSAVTFTPSADGAYTVALLVTDNEGAQSSTSVSFYSRGATGPWPGTYGRSEEITASCGGSPGNGGSAGGMSADPRGRNFNGKANLESGNTALTYSDPIRTRGFPLRLDLQINNQTKLVGRKTTLGNANFTYSIAVVYYSYLNSGGTQIKERYLVDADGTAVYIGSGWTGTPSVPSYFKGNLQSNTVLANAGPPGKISYAGNYKYEFLSGGALSKITDPQGNIQQLTYDSNGRLTTVTDQNTGKTITFLYNTGADRPYRVVENSGESKIDFTYVSDRVTSVKIKDSTLNVMQQLDITYNGQGLISTVQKDGDSSSLMTYTYYTQGNGVALGNISWPGGGTKINYFGIPGSGGWARSVITDSNGNKTSTDYDGNFLAVRKTLPTMNGASSPPTYTFTNDTTNYLVTAVSDGATTTNFTYNSKGKVTQVNNNAGGVWSFTYASNGIDLTGASDSIGTLLALVYGNSSLPHLPTSITGADGKTWTRTYNSYGQMLTEVPPTGSPTGTKTYTYEETTGSANKGMLKTLTNGAGDVTQFNGYTSLGDVTSIVQTPESGTNITTAYSYDGAQRALSETLPDGKQRTYSYNYRKLASITDEAGNNTAYSFCSICGKMSGLTAPLSKSLSWQEDGDHRTTGFTDARSNQTQYQYGNAGELKKTLYPDGSYTLYRYDNYGRLAATEDTRGDTQVYTYDSVGRLQKLTLTPAGGTGVDLTYTYNADDTVSSVTDEVGTTTYSYTAGRRVSNVGYDWNASGLSNAQNVSYSYNNDGTIDTVTWKNGTTTVATWSFSYDGAGRVTSIVNGFGETTSFSYDGVGKLKTQTNQNGTSLTYTWNQQRGWPTQILQKSGSTPFAQYDLAYDGGNNTAGNLTQVIELDGSEVDYTYDALYRLTGETRTGTGPYARSYGYDLAGNLTTYGGSTFASYDSANKISTLSGGSVSYDADGNATAISGSGIPSTTLTWDVRSRLTRQVTSSDDISYRYDYTGKRVARWPSGSTGQVTFYVFSGDKLLGELQGGSPAVAYTWGPVGLVSSRNLATSQSTWYHFGPQAETRGLSDASGAIVADIRYDAYGNQTYSSLAQPAPFLFGGAAGYYQDGNSGLILSTHRWYSPYLHRWASMDPIGSEGGDNRTRYADNNPVKYVDSKGLDLELALPEIPPPPAELPPIEIPPGAGQVAAAAVIGVAIGTGIDYVWRDDITDFLMGPDPGKEECHFDPTLEWGKIKRRKRVPISKTSDCKNKCYLAAQGLITQAQRLFCNKVSDDVAVREQCRTAMASAVTNLNRCLGWCDGEPWKKDK
ncbi:MAG: hypothetical protein K2X38_21825 [Gemmataceae bacterium]|nr:hypothetical protein [Gemmataceae bacterium]